MAADEPRDLGPSHPSGGERVNYVGLTWPSVALVVTAVVLSFLLRDAFVAAHRTVGWVVACSIVALLIAPLVDVLDRHIPRAIAVVAVLLGILALVVGVGFGVIREISDSIDDLSVSAERAAAELEEQYTWAADAQLADRVADFVEDVDESVGDDALVEAASTIPTYVVTGILMLFLLAFGRRYVDAFLEQFAPERAGPLGFVLRTAGTRGRTYLLCALAHSLVNGVVVAVVCWALDLPAAISLGVCVALLTILPLIGVLVGGVPALLLAFGLEGWMTGWAVLVTLVGLQAVEIVVVRRWVDRRTVRVGPTTPIVVGLLGYELYGVGGAVYGIALAVIALAALDAVGQLRGEPVEPVDAPEPAETAAPADAVEPAPAG